MTDEELVKHLRTLAVTHPHLGTAQAADRIEALTQALKEMDAKLTKRCEVYLQLAKSDGLREGLEMAAKICDEEGDEWDSDRVITEKNYARHAGARILAIDPAGLKEQKG